MDAYDEEVLRYRPRVAVDNGIGGPAPARPERIDGDFWLTRVLERPVPILGQVICSSTRGLVGGPTGSGKTHVAMGMAGAIATGRGFLHWVGPASPLPVLFIDGEMARDLIQERLRDLQRRMGGPSLANLHVLCREDFPAMQGFNTADGQAFLQNVCNDIRPSVVFLDNRMSLIVGDMKDEVPWTETMPLVWWLTRQQIAQVWIDHTGHDGGHIYGSKTKEWQMDFVALLDHQPGHLEDIRAHMTFTKARRRSPESREDFGPGTITLDKDLWLWQPDEPKITTSAGPGRPRSPATDLMLKAVRFLASAPEVPLLKPYPDMTSPVRAVTREALRKFLIDDGWFSEGSDLHSGNPGGISGVTDRGFKREGNALMTLKSNGVLGYDRKFVWPT